MNCFSGLEDDGHDDLISGEKVLYLWYKYEASIEMEEFEDKIKKHSQYICTIDVDQYHVLYKFSIPDKFKNDYSLIMEGKYSYVSEEAKERILNFHSASENTPLGKILNRDSSRREKMESELGISIPKEADLHDPPYIKDEIYFNRYNVPKPRLG